MMNNGTYGRGSTLNTIFFSDQKEYGCRYCKHCDIESLKCYPESRDCESEYDLNIGMNTIEIKVTAEDGSEKIYQIHVQRNKKKSNNTNIIKLVLNQSDVTFDNDKGHVVLYDVIKNKQDIKMQCTVEDVNAKCEMDQWEKKDNIHSTLTIYVTAEDGTIRYYTIEIEVEETSVESILLFVGLWLLAFVFALYYYYKKNKPEVIEKWKEKITKKDSNA